MYPKDSIKGECCKLIPFHLNLNAIITYFLKLKFSNRTNNRDGGSNKRILKLIELIETKSCPNQPFAIIHKNIVPHNTRTE